MYQFDPWPMLCKMCDITSQCTIDKIKEGDIITFELGRKYPYSGRKTKTRTREVQKNGKDEMIIIDYSPKSIQELFNENKIVEIRLK